MLSWYHGSVISHYSNNNQKKDKPKTKRESLRSGKRSIPILNIRQQRSDNTRIRQEQNKLKIIARTHKQKQNKAKGQAEPRHHDNSHNLGHIDKIRQRQGQEQKHQGEGYNHDMIDGAE